MADGVQGGMNVDVLGGRLRRWMGGWMAGEWEDGEEGGGRMRGVLPGSVGV